MFKILLRLFRFLGENGPWSENVFKQKYFFHHGRDVFCNWARIFLNWKCTFSKLNEPLNQKQNSRKNNLFNLKEIPSSKHETFYTKNVIFWIKNGFFHLKRDFFEVSVKGFEQKINFNKPKRFSDVRMKR